MTKMCVSVSAHLHCSDSYQNNIALGVSARSKEHACSMHGVTHPTMHCIHLVINTLFNQPISLYNLELNCTPQSWCCEGGLWVRVSLVPRPSSRCRIARGRPGNKARYVCLCLQKGQDCWLGTVHRVHSKTVQLRYEHDNMEKEYEGINDCQ